MAFLVSPGVQVKEVDLTNVVPAVATSIGAIAGSFDKGPVGEVTAIGSEEELVKIFGKPNASNYETWFTAANFLQYSDALRVVRVESGVLNATSNASGLLIRSTDHYTTSFAEGQGNVGLWAARTSGSEGNSIAISVCASGTAYEQNLTTANKVASAAASGATSITLDDIDAADNEINVGDILAFFTSSTFATQTSGHEDKQYEVTFVDITNNTATIRELDNVNGTGLVAALPTQQFIRRRWKFYDMFDGAPGTSAWATQNGRGTGDELHIVVFDTTGTIAGFDSDTAGQRLSGVLETFASLSKNPNAKTAQGQNNFYPDVIYRTSSFIYWMDHPITSNIPTSKADEIGSSGTNWGQDLQTGNEILMNGTDASGTNEGDNIILDGTDGSSTNAGGDILLEQGGSYTSVTGAYEAQLNGGSDDFAVSAGEIALAYDKFKDVESIDINLVLGGPSSVAADTLTGHDTHVTMITDLVEFRKDCVGFVSPYRNSVVGIADSVKQTDNVKKAFDACPSSSYMVFDSGYKYMYDKYNDQFRFVPLNGDTAGLCANTDNVADPWFSPGGFNRGNVRGAVKLAFNPSKSQRDILYRARINPVVNFPGQGVVLFGDKTALTKPSAFDRINVRRLFLVLEKAIATAAKFQLFEFNDEFTRAQFRNLVEPFLRDVQGRRGITDFKVIADGTNNTGQVIDRNEFVADIYVKPNRSINFITLNFVAVRTGVAFTEVGG